MPASNKDISALLRALTDLFITASELASDTGSTSPSHLAIKECAQYIDSAAQSLRKHMVNK